MLEQLGRLDAERHRQVLRRVEAIPITLVGEAAQGLRELGKGVDTGKRRVGIHAAGTRRRIFQGRTIIASASPRRTSGRGPDGQPVQRTRHVRDFGRPRSRIHGNS